jgi:dTDP-4-dehydrorhamnose 3,5-epimerase
MPIQLTSLHWTARQMKFHPTSLRDCWLIELETVQDERGCFVRTFCAREFCAGGLQTSFPQHSVSMTVKRGTVRGMHFQRDPHGEAKLVRCVRGRIWDAVVDIRPDSPTFGRWQGFELCMENGRQLYVPEGFAHGYQTLTDDVEVSYLISTFYVPEASWGIRHDDPAVQIAWPLPIAAISDKDRSWPDLRTR